MSHKNPSHYKTLQSIVDQLEFCGYKTEDGLHVIESNTAFIALKEKAVAETAEQNKQKIAE